MTDRGLLACRDLRHAWDWDTDSEVVRLGRHRREFTRHLVCLRCATTRTDTYEIGRNYVAKVHTRYGYPEGYKVPGGISVEAVRLELFTRMIK